MSHKRDCPTRWEAERQGERDQSYGRASYSNPYSRQPFENDHCREAERAWEDGHRSAQRRQEEQEAEERAQQRVAQQRRWDHEAQEADWQRQECERAEQEEAEEAERIEAEHYFWLEQESLMDTGEGA